MDDMPVKDKISLCICTYKRPNLLYQLLQHIQKQQTNDLFVFDVVIVDNDKNESARPAIDKFRKVYNLKISYDVEHIQNISLARNRAIKNTTGNLIALIDDDELPISDWLLKLYYAINKLKADGILGPVLPKFEKPPPQWVLKGKLFDRPIHKTGHILNWQNTRTGNALLKKSLFFEKDYWFDPLLGNGGEDRDFFKRKILLGHSFAWCNEAAVYEIIPKFRWERKFLFKRALLRGTIAFTNTDNKTLSALKSSIALVSYSLIIPILFFINHHIFMVFAIKFFDHLGYISSLLNINIAPKHYVNS